MSKTPSLRLRLPLLETGDEPNAWGVTLRGLFGLVDDSQGAISVPVNGNVTLTNDNYVTNQARYAGLRLTGTGLAGNAPALVTIPGVDKWRIVKNDCAGDITIGTGMGLAATVRAGRMSIVLCDGIDTFIIDQSLDQIRKAAADLDLNGKAITNLAVSTNPSSAARFDQTSNSWTQLAQAWATQSSGEVVTGQGYSALFNAILAKAWATQASGEVVTGQGFSAKYSANLSQAWATQPTGEVVVGQGYSAYYYAQLAQQFAPAGKATTAQAQAGTDDSTFMTPLKTSQAIKVLSSGADDLRTLAIQVAKLKGSVVGMAGGVADDFKDQSGYGAPDTLTTALLHFDGANNSTTFTDALGGTYTAAGGAVISTAQSVFGGASFFMPANGSGVSAAANARYAFGTGDFTINARIYPTLIGGGGSAFYIYDTGSGGGSAYLQSSGSALTMRFSDGNTVLTGTTAIPINSWTDVEINRSSGTVYIFINGNLDVSGLANSNLGTSQPLYIGNNANLNSSLRGYLDEFRISKGIARHTSAFTPATSAFGLGDSINTSYDATGNTVTNIVSGSPAAMDLRSVVFPAQAVPTKGSLFFLAKPTNGSVSLNINLTASLSRDGGTTYTTAVLTSTGTLSSGYAVCESNSFDISTQPSGSSMKWRIQTTGTTLGVAIDAVVAQWG